MNHLARAMESYGRLTATAGTAILQLLSPRKGHFTRITKLRYISGGTAHTLTLLTVYGRTTVAQAQAASDTSLKLAADPGTGTGAGAPASGDYFVVEHADGTYGLYAASAWSGGTLTATIGALSKAIAVGGKVFFLGAVGDSQHAVLLPPASATTEYPAGEDGGVIAVAKAPGDPVVVHSNNATAAGTLELVNVAFTKEGYSG